MKRVQISPGRYVTVSTEMAERAARVFASGAFTAAQVREAAAAEPRGTGSVLIGHGGVSEAPAPRTGANGLTR